MSSSDYKSVALTDYDRFPEDIDGEGDAFSLGSKRTTTFMSSGMTLVRVRLAGTSATQNGDQLLRMKRRRLPAYYRCLIVVTAAAFTGLARIAENIFSRKSPI
jgi:phage terminase large subunit GpA-like protein